MAVIQARIPDEEAKFIANYAKVNNITISALIRQTIMEKIEDELDLQAYEDAMAEYRANPVSYTLDEVMKELDLI
ncbi:MAG: DUF6290 family protein [Oscillospiraceae bacterium]|jgi:hypothetical protein|nr:DUF6290 family protein [Oscillospiraceae bacterium]